MVVAIVIQIVNGLFLQLSVQLTDLENNRFESEYEESLIAKLYVFQFMNSYAMLFYLAFFRIMLGDECEVDVGCMGELSLALFVIFGYRLVFSNAQEYLWPYAEPHVRAMFRMLKQSVVDCYKQDNPEDEATKHFIVKGLQESLEAEKIYEEEKIMKLRLLDTMSAPEYEFNLEEYSKQDQAISDYSDLVVEFGFVTFFVAAFPLAPLFAFVNNFFQIRIDASKMLCSMRRPMPLSANGIGTWLDIYQINSIIAVITNSGIVAFSMEPYAMDTSSFGLFIGMQYFLFTLMALAAWIVPDVPGTVPIQLKRQEFIVNKVIKGVPDPGEVDFAAHTKDLCVNETDNEV